jgi:hypothetical protein
MPASAPVMVQCRTCSSIIQAVSSTSTLDLLRLREFANKPSPSSLPPSQRCIKRHEQSKKHLRAQESRSRKVASSLQKASPNPETTLEQEVSSNSIPLPTFEHKASPNPVTNLDPLPTFKHKALPNPVTNLDPLPTFEQKASPYSAHGWTKAHDIRLKNLIQHLNTTEAGWSPTNQFIYDLLATDCFPRLPFRRLSQISRRFYNELQVDGIHGFKEEIDVMDEVKEVEKVHQDGTIIIFRLLSHSTWEGTTNYRYGHARTECAPSKSLTKCSVYARSLLYSEEDDARILVTTSDDNMMILKRYSSDSPDVCETYFARPSSISVRVKSEPATIIVFKDTMQEERLHAMVLAPIQINRARSHHQLPHVAMSTRSTASIEAKDLDTLDPGRLIVNSVVNAFARHLQSLLDNDTQNDGVSGILSIAIIEFAFVWLTLRASFQAKILDCSSRLLGVVVWEANLGRECQSRSPVSVASRRVWNSRWSLDYSRIDNGGRGQG